jgi:hypothetical protein
MSDVEMPHARQHISFEMYSPTTYTDASIPIVERVSIQQEWPEGATLNDFLAMFNRFLKACDFPMEGIEVAVVNKNHYNTVKESNNA